jgi:hypothetical protein
MSYPRLTLLSTTVAAALALMAPIGASAMCTQSGDSGCGSLVRGTGTQTDPYIWAFNRPEQEDALHQQNGSICHGTSGFYSAFYSNIQSIPAHDSYGYCFPLFGPASVTTFGGDSIYLNGKTDAISCEALSGTTCGLGRVQWKYGEQFDGDPGIAGTTMTEELPGTVFQSSTGPIYGDKWYGLVWGPPTTFCASPATPDVLTIKCSYSRLVAVGEDPHTNFG